jgi:hypothetical protein
MQINFARHLPGFELSSRAADRDVECFQCLADTWGYWIMKKITAMVSRGRSRLDLVRLRLTRAHKLVADSRGRKYKLGPSGIALQLLTQAGHVCIDRTRERPVLITPQRP